MSKLLAYLNALGTNAVLIQAHKNDPQKAARDFGLSVDEQLILLRQDRKEISSFLDIPFRDFDAMDTTETYFQSWETVGDQIVEEELPA